MTKTILFIAIAAVLVAGIVSADHVLAAKEDVPQGQPFTQLDQRVVVLEQSKASVDSFFDVIVDVQESFGADSFFDVFTQLQTADAAQQAQIDSFFDVFVDALRPTTTSTITPLEVPLATAYFIKFDGVDGESQDKDHKDWSDIGSFTQGQYKPDSSSRRTGASVLEDIVVVKELDKSSPKLAEANLKGQVFPKVEIHVAASFTDAGRQVYYAYELKNVQVTSYGISGSGQNNNVPLEEIALNFEEIKVTYTEYDDKGMKKGNVEYTWKVEEGES